MHQQSGRRGYQFNPIIGQVSWRQTIGPLAHNAEATDWLEKYHVDRGEYGDMFARL